MILIMTIAGTRGASKGLYAMIDASENAKQILVFPRYTPPDLVPPEATRVQGEMTESRRTAIAEQLKDDWLAEHAQDRWVKDELIRMFWKSCLK
jgi:hypothetical protein